MSLDRQWHEVSARVSRGVGAEWRYVSVECVSDD